MDRKSWRRWLPGVTAFAATVGALIAADTAIFDIVRYSLYWCWSIILPGTLVYRALRLKRHSLLDDLVMGSALGLVLEMVGLISLSLIGLRALIPLWPLLAIGLTLAIRPVRRRVLANGGVRPSLSWSWAITGVYLFLLAYLTFEFLLPVKLNPADSQDYHIDLLYLLGMVTEAKAHFPIQIPSVAGEPLHYHWFSYAHFGMGSLVSGVDAPTVLFRTGLPPLFALAVGIMSVAGWRVSGRPWVGAGAAALTFVVGELAIGSLAWSQLGGEVAYAIWVSPSLVYSYVFGLAIIILIVEQLSRDSATYLKLPQLVLLAMFVFAAPGAKATVLPITLAALGVVCLAQLLTRKFSAAPWVIAGLVVIGQITAMIVLYGMEQHAISIEPFNTLLSIAEFSPAGPVTFTTYAVAFAGLFIFWTARLAGIPVALWLGRKTLAAREWFLLGGFAAGFAIVLLVNHPSLSQLFFLRAGYLFGAILSAMGVAALVDKLGIRPALVWRILAFAAVTSCAVWCALYLRYGATERIAGSLTFRVTRMGLAIAIVAVAILAAGALAGRRWPQWRSRAKLASLLVILSGGLLGLPSDAYFYPNMGGSYHQTVGAPQLAAARWIRENTGHDDLLATNGHCVWPTPGAAPYATCLHLSYWLSGFGERRVLLEGWGYTPKMASNVFAPFWDPEIEKINDEVFTAPTATSVRWMWDRGVRTLVADRRYNQESPALASFARLKWQQDYIAIYQLDPSATMPRSSK